MRVLVTGATGGVGRGVLEGLLAENVLVRAMSRDPQKAGLPAGVEAVEGDLGEPATLGKALVGVRAVFLYAQNRKLPELMDQMKRAGVEYVVFLSTIDATNTHEYAQANRRRHLTIEEAIAEAGFRYTFLRPGAFSTNALRFWRQSIVDSGIVRLPFPESQQAPIDERDISAVAVRALVSRELDGEAIVLTGPESLTQRQQIESISDVLARPIGIEAISAEEARLWLGKMLPPSYAELLVAQWRDEVGVVSQVTRNVERVLGRPATNYKTWVQRNAGSFGLT
jgi:uncharacterized protein YbjT (DUF2867 family)